MTCDVWESKLERYVDSELPEDELKKLLCICAPARPVLPTLLDACR
jgi:hypothetical protein